MLKIEHEPSARAAWLIDTILLAVVLVFNAWLLITNGTQRFEFFDMSAFMDAGYRVSIGQRPYIDFYYTAGPVHLYMHALSFMLFGFTKTAVMIHLCTVGLAATAIVFVISRLFLSRLMTLLLSLLTVYSFYGPISHPWYDQNAGIWLMVGILIWELRKAYLPAREDLSKYVAILLGVLAGLSFMTKANVGLAGGLLFLGILLPEMRRFGLVFLYVMGGFAALALIALILQKPANFIDQAFFAYSPGNRIKNFSRLIYVVQYTPSAVVTGAAAVLALLGGISYLRDNVSRFAILLGLIFVSVFSAWTSSMDLRGNIFFTGLEFLYLFILARNLPTDGVDKTRVRLRSAAAMFLILASLYYLHEAVLVTREIVIWTWNPYVMVSDYAIQTESFRGWKCNQMTGEGMDKAVDFIKTRVPENDSLFVFPDVTMIYGLTGRDSYRKAPFIFQRYQLPGGRWFDEFREHFLREPPRWIVLHNQREHVQPDVTAGLILEWLHLDGFVASRYEKVWEFEDFSILKANP